MRKPPVHPREKVTKKLFSEGKKVQDLYTISNFCVSTHVNRYQKHRTGEKQREGPQAGRGGGAGGQHQSFGSLLLFRF